MYKEEDTLPLTISGQWTWEYKVVAADVELDKYELVSGYASPAPCCGSERYSIPGGDWYCPNCKIIYELKMKGGERGRE